MTPRDASNPPGSPDPRLHWDTGSWRAEAERLDWKLAVSSRLVKELLAKESVELAALRAKVGKYEEALKKIRHISTMTIGFNWSQVEKLAEEALREVSP